MVLSLLLTNTVILAVLAGVLLNLLLNIALPGSAGADAADAGSR